MQGDPNRKQKNLDHKEIMHVPQGIKHKYESYREKKNLVQETLIQQRIKYKYKKVHTWSLNFHLDTHTV